MGFWHSMSQSFKTLMQGGEGSGDGDGVSYSELQSSEDVPDSTATTATTTAGDGGGGGGVGTRDGGEDDFTDDNNFESNLRRRKGKIISCAKETIENGESQSQKTTIIISYFSFLFKKKRIGGSEQLNI